MSVWKNPKSLQCAEYIYDFADDGGAQGEIVLADKANHSPLPIGSIVCDCIVWVETAIVGSSSTVAFGNQDDPDGYMEAIAEGSLTQNSVHRAGSVAGAKLWDDTNDHMLAQYVSSSNIGSVSITIATGDLTAGRLVVQILYLAPQ